MQENKEPLLNFVYAQKDAYIKGFASVSEGLRQWNAIVFLVNDGTITTKEQLVEYGMVEGA